MVVVCRALCVVCWCFVLDVVVRCTLFVVCCTPFVVCLNMAC